MQWLLCALLALAPSATAQTSAAAGAIRGLTLDGAGAAIPGVRVTALNQETRISRITETDAGGRFFLGNLPVGSYTLRLEAAGFATVVAGPIVVFVGQVIEQRVGLQPAGIVEKLEVTDLPEAIDVSAATASVVLGGERIEEAPARSRNYLNFVLAAPGVAPSGGASSQRTMTGVRSPMGDSGFTFGGMRPRNNAILIDGMDNRDETTGGNRVAVGLEMVQEFRVAGSSVGAELGGAAGGLLNMVTRSGVNVVHGDATFFAQNEVFNAVKPEVGDSFRPRFRRYQPGVSLLGPLRRDRTFVAAAIEHERESAGEWSGVPAESVPLINAALASPAFSRATAGSVLRGLYDTSTRGTDLSSKLSHQFRDKDTFSARYAFSRGRVLGEVQGPDNFADRSAQGSSLTTDHSFVGNWLRVASPTTVNEIRIQAASRSMNLQPNSGGPMLEIPGVATMGEYYRMRADRTERHYQLVENLNVAVRGHRLSLGADAHLIRFDGSLRSRFAGIYVFPSLDAFAAGRPDVFLQAFGNPHTRMNTAPLGMWIQDRWEARPGLHLELGLRYDRQRMPTPLPSSTNNRAPRVGLAWRPAKDVPLVLRAGFGLYFDRYPLAYLNDAVQKDGVRAFEQYLTGSAAQAVFAASRGGLLTAPATAGRSIYRASEAFPSTYGRKFNLGMEYGLDKNTSFSVEANHVRGFHLPRVRNEEAALPPRYLLEQTAKSDYVGASFTLNRRLHNDLGYLFSYSVGRTRDDASDFDEHPMDPRDVRRDWGPSRQHQLHRVALSALFEIPVEHWLLEDVSFAPIFTIGSGRPINVLATTDVYRTGAYPISARPAGMARNAFQAPGIMSLDLRLMKTFHVMNDRALLQFGVESFNLTNHASTERVSQYFTATFGRTLESLPARQVQFLVQFEF
ncbi:MAG: TonB-dependent receptor [Bryobacteraceae bacterium]|nr:TonB-dependent receptor [Bryobacteraceae bacterium]